MWDACFRGDLEEVKRLVEEEVGGGRGRGNGTSWNGLMNCENDVILN